MKYLSTIFCLVFLLALSAPGTARDTASAQHKAVKEIELENEEAIQPGEVAYQVLLSEIALQRGEVGLASDAYSDLAFRTRDVAALERATEIALFTSDYERALNLIKVWREVDPSSRRAQQRLFQALILSAEPDQLSPKLVEVLRSQPQFLTDNLLLLNSLFARAADRIAVYRVFEKIGEQFPGIAEAHYAVALAANSAGAGERGEMEIDRALELRPDWEMAAFIKVQYLASRSNQEAIDFMQNFLKVNPDAREVELQLARLLISERRFAESKAHFERLLKTAPESPEILYPAAILALQQGDKELAETYLKRLIALDISDKSRAYYYLGQIAEEMQHKDQAIDYYARITSGEDYIVSQIRRARLWNESGEAEQADRILQTIKAKTPAEEITLTMARASLLREAGRIQEAFDLIEPLIRIHPDNPELLYDSSLMAERLGHYEEMEKRLRKLIDLRPDNPLAYNALGYSFADRGIRLAEAQTLIEKANELSPDDSYILDSLGWVAFKQGALEKALVYLKRAYALRADPEIAAHIGEALWALGRQDEARRQINEALNNAPSNESLLEAAARFAP